jgi:hypothetical protein
LGEALVGVISAFEGRLLFTASVFTLSNQFGDVKSLSLQMSMKRNKTAQINLRITPALKEAAEEAAAADQRSLTSLVEKLLTDYIGQQHAAPPKRKGK